MNKYTFHVSGTHCASCKILIEDILNEQIGVQNTHVDLKNKLVSFETDLNNTEEEIANMLTEKIVHNGYILSLDKIQKEKPNYNVLYTAIPIGILFLVLFFWLQKSGILNIGLGGAITPTTSFIIGLIASVSSCLAIVGGLVLSLSAKISQDNANNPNSAKKTFVLFHIGRIVSFAVLGGVLGVIGNAIGISFTFTAILGIIASLIMLVLGLNLVGVFARNRITLPSGIFNFFKKIEHKTLAPLLVGFGTFFLPCGFTQSMQFSALSSGSFTSGAILMLAFALGTLPVLLLLSFGSSSFAHSKYAPLFFKSAGVVVIGFGLFALLGGLAGLGIIAPLFNI